MRLLPIGALIKSEVPDIVGKNFRFNLFAVEHWVRQPAQSIPV